MSTDKQIEDWRAIKDQALENSPVPLKGWAIVGVPEDDIDRTTEEGKTSSVHFLHFPFPDDAKAAFTKAGTEVIIGCGHPKYGHMAVMPDEMRASLAGDFD